MEFSTADVIQTVYRTEIAITINTYVKYVQKLAALIQSILIDCGIDDILHTHCTIVFKKISMRI